MEVRPTHQIHRRKSSRDAEEVLDSMRASSPVSFPESDDDANRSRANSSPTQPLPINGHSHHHTSAPTHPPSAGPYRTTFVPTRAPSLPTTNGHTTNGASFPYRAPASPPNGMRTSPTHMRALSQSQSQSYLHSLNQPYGQTHLANGHASSSHSRTRSISTPFSPPISSPLASSFPPQSQSHPALPMSAPPTKQTFPSFSSFSAMSTSETDEIPAPVQAPSSPKPGSSRRHTRLHSRNLSVFFPRPGSLPTNSIAEDGSQELEVQVDDIEAPVSTIPAAGSSINFPSSRQPPTPLGAGFTFGERPPDNGGLPVPSPMSSRSNSTGSQSHSRRGHHHKHSMSHNFFSFLEPGANGIVRSNEDDLHTQPTPTPVSPWNPISPFPNSADAHSHHSHSPSPSPNPSVLSDLPSQNGDATHPFPPGHSHPPHHSVGLTGLGPKVAGATQFLLGAWVWVTGQQIGSLSCTGLGYWIVFDAFGVGIGVWAGKNLRSSFEQADDKQRKLRIRRPYGNARVETLLMFAQAVYLMFSSVYVCKETVEHLLLSAGAGAGVGGGVGSGGHSDGHHHHHGGTDEAGEFLGIEFPIFLTLTALFSLFYTAVAFGNHGKLLRVSGNRIPSVGTLIRRFTRSISRATSRSSSYAFDYEDPPTSILGDVLSNPYVASPLFFAFSLLCIPYGFDESQHHLCDLVLACVITVVTFNVAYQASVVLGTVLLQTSPPRGSSGSSKMDSFLRVIKEIERHPQVVHMPPPHIWQLTPSAATPVLSQGTSNSESLVVTLELHVKENLGDDDVLRLTSWAWDKCVTSLRGRGEDSRSNDADVTVGVVRG